MSERNGTSVRVSPQEHAGMRAGLSLLLQASDYAEDVDQDPWQFAVEIPVLHEVGLTRSDLRWLICKEYLQHAREITLPSEDRREYHAIGNLSLEKRSCFVLSASGIHYAGQMIEPRDMYTALPSSNGPPPTVPRATPAPPLGPRWDSERQEFSLGDQLVKRFKLPSPNQETILMAFEEEEWPPRIDDPLPPHPDLDPKRRLHDTIKSLNRNQKLRLVRFMGDGTGQGIRWEMMRQEGNGKLLSEQPSQ